MIRWHGPSNRPLYVDLYFSGVKMMLQLRISNIQLYFVEPNPIMYFSYHNTTVGREACAWRTVHRVRT